MTRKRIGIAIAVAAVIAAIAFVAYWIGSAVSPTGAETASCKKSACGPFEVLDCGAAFDGPLFIYSRFTGHYLGDCGYWASSLYNTSFCPVAHKTLSFCD